MQWHRLPPSWFPGFWRRANASPTNIVRDAPGMWAAQGNERVEEGEAGRRWLWAEAGKRRGEEEDPRRSTTRSLHWHHVMPHQWTGPELRQPGTARAVLE